MEKRIDTQDQQTLHNGSTRLRRFGIIAAGIGIGSVLTYILSKALQSAEKSPKQFSDHIVDDRGTNQKKAAKIPRNLRDRGFDASNEKLALALGRPSEEVAGWTTGLELIDDDVVMKARGIAMNRGVRIE